MMSFFLLKKKKVPAVTRLPEEVLVKIFSMNNDMDQDPPLNQRLNVHYRAIEMLRSVSQVNQRWRTAALCAPNLWANVIDVDFLLSLAQTDWMMEVMERTQEAPLTVRWHPRRRPYRSQVMHEFFTQYWPRVKKLDLIAFPTRTRGPHFSKRAPGSDYHWGWDVEEDAIYFNFLAKPAPLLESFTFVFPVISKNQAKAYWHINRTLNYCFPFNHQAPKLRNFNCNLLLSRWHLVGTWNPTRVETLTFDSCAEQPLTITTLEVQKIILGHFYANLETLVVRRPIVFPSPTDGGLGQTEISKPWTSLRHIEITGNQQLGPVLKLFDSPAIDSSNIKTLILHASLSDAQMLEQNSLDVLTEYLTTSRWAYYPSWLAISVTLHHIHVRYSPHKASIRKLPIPKPHIDVKINCTDLRQPHQQAPLSCVLLKTLLFNPRPIGTTDVDLYLSSAIFSPLDNDFIQFIQCFENMQTLRTSGQTVSLLTTVMSNSPDPILPRLHTLIMTDLDMELSTFERFCCLRKESGLPLQNIEITVPEGDSESEGNVMDLTFLNEFVGLKVKYTHGAIQGEFVCGGKKTSRQSEVLRFKKI